MGTEAKTTVAVEGVITQSCLSHFSPRCHCWGKGTWAPVSPAPAFSLAFKFMPTSTLLLANGLWTGAAETQTWVPFFRCSNIFVTLRVQRCQTATAWITRLHLSKPFASLQEELVELTSQQMPGNVGRRGYSCGWQTNRLSHSNWILSLGINRAWSCPNYKTVWNIHTHTHTHIMYQEAFYKSTVCMVCCWKSWRWDGKHGKIFCKSRKKKKIDVLQLGLCCVVAVWEWWHRWEVVIPLPSSSSLMQLCLLFVFAQKIFGFLQILRRVFPIFFFQPLPELQKLKIHI